MALNSPLKMKYSGTAPKGVPAMNKGKSGSETGPKVMKGVRSAGEMYKKPGTIKRQGAGAKDQSSGQSNPRPAGDDNKKRYNGVTQPLQYSNANGPRPTKFVC